MPKIIELTQGQVAKVCDCHAHLVRNNNWFAIYAPNTKSFYAARGVRVLGKRETVYMATVINNTPAGYKTDHKNGNTLDNQCSNLRTATSSESGMNRRKPSNNTSGCKGVTWHKRYMKWYASIKVKGKQTFLGAFSDLSDAARAYDLAAIKYHGEFAVLNFPRSDYP